MCGNDDVEVRGQFAGSDFLLVLCVPWESNSGARLGGKPLHHWATSPSLIVGFEFIKICCTLRALK